MKCEYGTIIECTNCENKKEAQLCRAAQVKFSGAWSTECHVVGAVKCQCLGECYVGRQMKRTEQLEAIAHDCFEILEHYGWKSQKLTLIEEIGELLTDLSREGRGRETDVQGELADVAIMLFQAMDHYGFDECIERMQEKIERQFNRIEKEN